MIELNEKTQQDFLNREWVQRLLDAGVDMSDAKYCIVKYHNYDVVFYKNGIFTTNETVTNIIPTYTVSELLYKLHEWEDQNFKNKRCRGDVCLMPDAPYFMAFFHLVGEDTVEIYNNMCGMSETPIEALASLLIECYQNNNK